MSERLPNGTFAAGHKGGPGRPRRETEREYLDCLVGAVSLSAWRKVIAKAVADAKAGDTKAREWLGRYLLPAPRTDDDGDNRVPMKPDYEYMPISESDFAPAVDRGEPG